jgi:hypothetical protein
MICALRNCSDPLYRVFDVDITVGDFLGRIKKLVKSVQFERLQTSDSLKHIYLHTSNKK